MRITELYELGFAQSAWRHKAYILSVGEHLDELLALFLSVAKVFFRNIAYNNEWIQDHGDLFLRQRYRNYTNRIIILYILYYTNCIIISKSGLIYCYSMIYENLFFNLSRLRYSTI